MKFFHVYDDHFVKGLEINGFINKDAGIKLKHSWSLKNKEKFNEYAKKGSAVYNYIKETKMPMYVDRFCGGSTWHDYVVDKTLTEEYRKILGDWFLGFQVHESGSNRRRSEWPIMIKRMGHKGPYDLNEMREKMLHKYVTNVLEDGTRLFATTQDNIEYYSTLKYAETYPEFLDEMTEMFKRRISDTGNNVIPCDSYFLATKMQNDLGVRTFMPEVGAQIPLMRIAVALARGVAKAYNKTWGVYYECWREEPGVDYFMPNYSTSAINEWNLRTEEYISFYGENGGSSRLLQDRIYNHAYMSGADYCSEEWEGYTSYLDLQNFTLSPYGKLKKEFINRTQKIGKVKAKIPFAIVLPQEFCCIELPDIFTDWKIGEYKKTHLSSPLSPEEINYFGHIEDVLKLIFARVEQIGNEGHVLTNSRFGDQFDIVYYDTPEEALAKYDYLIDATMGGEFIKAKANSGLKILDSSNLDKLESKLYELTKEIMPCYVEGLPWIISVDEKGNQMLSIFNNEGNTRSLAKGDTVDDKANKWVKVCFKDATVPTVLYSSHKFELEKIDDKTYNMLVSATGNVIMKF